MDLKLAGLRAIVMGGTAGIGASIAETLAKEGCHVAICSRNQAKVDRMLAVLRGYSIQTLGASVDIANAPQQQEWIHHVAAELGGIDIFIANASALSSDWQETLNTDVLGTVEGVAAAVPYLKKSGSGALVYIGSRAAAIGLPTLAAYAAAKAAMIHYMKSLSLELVKNGVRVNVVSPGDTFVEGGFWDNIKHSDPETFEDGIARNPMGRLCTPQEIANVVVFLASPAASFVAGTHLMVDGASTAHVHF